MIARGSDGRRAFCASLAFIAGISLTGAAFAHAPPRATGITWIGERALVRTNRGFILQDVSGPSFRLLCNDAVGASLTETPPARVTADGRLLVATFTKGLTLSSPDFCSFAPVAGFLENMLVVDLADDALGRFHVAAIPIEEGASVLFESGDDGRLFERGAELSGSPNGVSIAPSDPSRVYVSASVTEGDAAAAELQISSDEGRSFSREPIMLTGFELRAMVLGVAPLDADRVFVRTQSRDSFLPERLLLRTGADGAFTAALETFGPIVIASDEDGAIWAGSTDGLFHLDEATQAFVPATSFDLTYVTCLATRGGRLYACGFHANEFGVLVSSDRGSSFEWFLRFPWVTARLDCPAGSDEATRCATGFADWSVEQGLTPAVGGAGGAAAGGGSGPGGAVSLGGSPSGAGSAGTPNSMSPSNAPPRGQPGGCTVGPLEPGFGGRPARALALLVACAAFFARRLSLAPR